MEKYHANDFCLESDNSDLSFPRGLSSYKEQEIDNMLADNYERWTGFCICQWWSYEWLGKFFDIQKLWNSISFYKFF